MLGAYKARVAPFNVNYRYVAEELRYLLADARREGDRLPLRVRADARRGAARPARRSTVLLQVDDELGQRPAPRRRSVRGRRSRRRPPRRRRSTPSPDDLYILYTGGTTGMPKGVLWRQADIFVGAMGGRPLATAPSSRASTSSSRAPRHRRRPRCCRAPPFMHGAAHWLRFPRLHRRQHGRASRTTRTARPRRRLVARSSASGSNILLIVGDAFARPLLDELEPRRRYDLSLARSCCSRAARR